MKNRKINFQYTACRYSFSKNLSRLQRIGTIFGYALWVCLHKRRALAQNKIQTQLNLSPSNALDIAYNSFLHAGRSFSEILVTRAVDHRFMNSRVRLLNPKNIHTMTSIPRPIIATTAHLGAWELMAGILRISFQGRRSQIIVKGLKNKKFQKALTALRQIGAVEIIQSKNAASQVLPALRRDNGVSAFLVDHHTRRSKAMFLPFLSEPATVNFGPALLALRSNALVWPIFMVRSHPGHFNLHSFPALDTATLQGTLRDKLKTIVSFYTLAVEKMVRSYPEQWFWMHNRWRSQPRGEEIVDPSLYQVKKEQLINP